MEWDAVPFMYYLCLAPRTSSDHTIRHTYIHISTFKSNNKPTTKTKSKYKPNDVKKDFDGYYSNAPFVNKVCE